MYSNTDIMTAIANDNGYENIFANSLDNFTSNLGDLLICFSVSGKLKLKNIINAMKLVQEKEI